MCLLKIVLIVVLVVIDFVFFYSRNSTGMLKDLRIIEIGISEHGE